MGDKTPEIILGQGKLEFEFTVREHGGGTADGRCNITHLIELVAPNPEKTGISEFETHG